MSQITKAIAARQTQITELQSEIEILQRAAGIVAPAAKAAAKATSQKAPSQPKAKARPLPQTKPKAQPKAQRKRRQWSAAEKAAIGKRMKAYWAKRRKAKG